MENIAIDGSPKTPTVLFSADQGVLEIKGRSIPENSIEFYKPLLDWIEEYSRSPKDNTVVNIQLEYFNTSSSKCLLDLFKRLEASDALEIQWFFDADDEDMLEAGEDYDHIVGVPFKFVEVDPEA